MTEKLPIEWTLIYCTRCNAQVEILIGSDPPRPFLCINCEKDMPPRQTWAYKSARIPPGDDLVPDRLNALGREGWEVIQMTWIPPIYEPGDHPASLNLMKWIPGTNAWLVFLKRGSR